MALTALALAPELAVWCALHLVAVLALRDLAGQDVGAAGDVLLRAATP